MALNSRPRLSDTRFYCAVALRLKEFLTDPLSTNWSNSQMLLEPIGFILLDRIHDRHGRCQHQGVKVRELQDQEGQLCLARLTYHLAGILALWRN